MAKAYADRTYNSWNPLRRYAQRKRFQKSLAFTKTNSNTRLLDFGCGDGFFLNQLRLSEKKCEFMIGYDPHLVPISGNCICLTSSLDKVMGHSPFNIVTCFETLEHFTEPMQLELLGQIASLLGENGTVILSVPIEKGFPSLIKNIIRRFSCEKSHRHFYSLRNMWRAFHGQRFPEFRSGNEFLWSHVGFYYDDLEKLFQKIGFVIEDKKYSPFSFLGTGFNSQVFYRLRKE